jgi:hypothetical protein
MMMMKEEDDDDDELFEKQEKGVEAQTITWCKNGH